LSRLEGAARNFYLSEADFVDRITNISGIIKSVPKGEARKKACFKALTEIKLTSIVYLPSNPDYILLEIDYPSASPMQRFLFKNLNCSIIFYIKCCKGSLSSPIQNAILWS